MARYIDANKLVDRLKVSPIFQDFNIDGYFIRDMVIDLVGCQPTADVVPKSEVAKDVISDIKKLVHNNAVYAVSKDEYSYINLKVFDAVLQNYINKFTEGEGEK